MSNDVGSELSDLNLETSYTSSGLGLLKNFYIPCLSTATQYDRAVGYFRSSLYALTGVAMSDFARRGGTCRVVCSPRLRKPDIEAMGKGYELRKCLDERMVKDINEILKEPRNVPVVEFMSTLIAADVLELRLAMKPDKVGLFHDKMGIFGDTNGNLISFVGSINETYSGWAVAGNHENFEVFASWVGGRESARIERHRRYFDELWKGEREALRVVDVPDKTRSLLEEYVDDGGVGEAIQKVRDLVGGVRGTRTVTTDSDQRSLYDHQEDAVDEWLEADCQGIVKHATGAGKTVTAVNIIGKWTDDGRTAIVAVPSLVLLDQWIQEVKVDLPDIRILRVSGESKDRGWRERLADFTRDMPSLGRRLVVTTIQTGRTQAFRSRVQDGEHLLLVVDEVHRAGSNENSKLFDIDAGGRLGLSATPERYGDPDGTRRIVRYFSGILDCEFSLRDAVEQERLVPYDYHIHEVSLTQSEQEEWNVATEEIVSAYARLPEDDAGNKKFTSNFRHLLIDRSKILKQADRKFDLAQSLLSDKYSKGDRWLVYCDSQPQLRAVTEDLREVGLPTYTYHSNMAGSREATMNYFRENPCILVAIRCLDEGVDVPAANAALILASSSNPREYIQRRGRVLRKDEKKYSASIHDAVVVPPLHGGIRGTEAILGTEIGRAAVFAQLARNRAPYASIRNIARRFGADLDELTDDKLAYEAGEEKSNGEDGI